MATENIIMGMVKAGGNRQVWRTSLMNPPFSLSSHTHTHTQQIYHIYTHIHTTHIYSFFLMCFLAYLATCFEVLRPPINGYVSYIYCISFSQMTDSNVSLVFFVLLSHTHTHNQQTHKINETHLYFKNWIISVVCVYYISARC